MEKIGIIDLGSNSARLVIVNLFQDGYFMVVDELKESVRLGQDMERDGFLKPQRVAETIKTLKMFRKLCDASGVSRIITVATEAVRKAKNQRSFLDEIQEYGKLLPLLKFINQDGRYRYIASGSALGVELSRTSSIPMGSITIERLFPLDFEEFLWAAGVAKDLIAYLRSIFKEGKEVDDAIHTVMMAHLRTYLLTGGLPEAVRLHFEGSSIDTVRKLHTEILDFYAADCAKYDSGHRLQIMRIYRMLPSFMEQKKKRIVYKKIDPKSARADRYADEFDYLSACGVALPALAVSNPVFPLLESATKNLLKLYLNDVGLLSSQFFAGNVRPVLEDVPSVNLGSLYETFVAMELSAHSHHLFYYDNREKGEVDFLINDYDNLCILPIEVKSGRDWQIHSSLTRMVTEGARKGIVLCNSNKARHREGITYLPVYMAAFL